MGIYEVLKKEVLEQSKNDNNPPLEVMLDLLYKTPDSNYNLRLCRDYLYFRDLPEVDYEKM